MVSAYWESRLNDDSRFRALPSDLWIIKERIEYEETGIKKHQ